MFRTIFAKQFTVFALALAVSFSAVALALSAMFRSYFIAEKTAAMTQQCERIAAAYISMAYGTFFNAQGVISGRATGRADFYNEVRNLNGYLGASLFVIDENGLVTACTSDITALEPGQSLDFPAFAPVLEGEVVSYAGNGGGLFAENALTVGYPIRINNGYILGGVFVKVPMSEVTKTTGGVIRLTAAVLAASLALAFTLFYLSSRAISRPIREINEAAKVIAAGDFGKRLTVKTKDEVGQLAAAFNDMAESLNTVEQSRREFIANISHDLRSPLTSMKGYAQAMQDGVVPEEAYGRYLGIIVEESDRLAKLANDIVVASATQEDAAELAVFDANELIRRTVALFEPKARAKRLNVRLDFETERTFICADAPKLSRVVFNLADNAVKFAPEGGTVSVSVSAEGRKARITVADDGPGLSREEARRVFDRFYKADASRGSDKSGHGLGLSIAKAFVMAHGETIDVQSEPGAGCAFSFCMPLSEQEP